MPSFWAAGWRSPWALNLDRGDLALGLGRNLNRSAICLADVIRRTPPTLKPSSKVLWGYGKHRDIRQPLLRCCCRCGRLYSAQNTTAEPRDLVAGAVDPCDIAVSEYDSNLGAAVCGESSSPVLWPGIVAIMFRSIGFIGKLLGEALEEIDTTPCRSS